MDIVQEQSIRDIIQADKIKKGFNVDHDNYSIHKARVDSVVDSINLSNILLEHDIMKDLLPDNLSNDEMLSKVLKAYDPHLWYMVIRESDDLYGHVAPIIQSIETKAKMSSIRSPIDSFDNYQNDTKEELTKPIHITFVVGSEQEPNTTYLPKPIAIPISSPPKPGSQYEPVSQERLPSQTGEMVTLSVPGVQSRSRSQPLARSQSPDRSRSPLQLPGSMSLSESLPPIESQFELLSPGTSSMISGDSVDLPVVSFDLFFDVNGLVNDPHYGDLRPTSTCLSGDSEGSNQSFPFSPGTEETGN